MARGSKPGERRGGRQKGTPNKATADVKEAARAYTTEAVEELARIMRESESDAARVSAIREILDRAHGKPSQAVAIGGDPNAPPVSTKTEVDVSSLSPEQLRALASVRLRSDA